MLETFEGPRGGESRVQSRIAASSPGALIPLPGVHCQRKTPPPVSRVCDSWNALCAADLPPAVSGRPAAAATGDLHAEGTARRFRAIVSYIHARANTRVLGIVSCTLCTPCAFVWPTLRPRRAGTSTFALYTRIVSILVFTE